jgi:hypothetical protein
VPDLHVSEFNDGLTEISTSENTANLPESKHAAFVRYFITRRQAFSKNDIGNIPARVAGLQKYSIKNTVTTVLRNRREWLEFDYG